MVGLFVTLSFMFNRLHSLDEQVNIVLFFFVHWLDCGQYQWVFDYFTLFSLTRETSSLFFEIKNKLLGLYFFPRHESRKFNICIKGLRLIIYWLSEWHSFQKMHTVEELDCVWASQPARAALAAVMFWVTRGSQTAPEGGGWGAVTAPDTIPSP